MKKTIIGLFILLLVSLALTACGNGTEVPDGMQIVYESDADGYCFFGPKDWVVSNTADIKCTYVSRLDHTSVTFVKSEIPMPITENIISNAELVDRFFTQSNERMASEPFSDYSLLPAEVKEGESAPSRLVSFGKAEGGCADEAYMYDFSFKYEGKDYRTMQIFVFYGEDFYIFTYSASAQKISEGSDKSYFEEYYDSSIKAVIENFTFKAKVPAEEVKTDYEKDESGNILVSKKSECGFKLWVPESYTPDYSTAIVSVTNENGSNITVSKLIDSTISIKDNYIERCEKLKAFSDKIEVTLEDGSVTLLPLFTEIKGVAKDADGNETVSIIDLPNARSAAEFEYTYTVGGVTYHVYQVYVVQGFLSVKAFVYTFTAIEENYAEDIGGAISILKGMEY